MHPTGSSCGAQTEWAPALSPRSGRCRRTEAGRRRSELGTPEGTGTTSPVGTQSPRETSQGPAPFFHSLGASPGQIQRVLGFPLMAVKGNITRPETLICTMILLTSLLDSVTKI